MISSHTYNQLNQRYKNYVRLLNITDPYILEHVDFKIKHTYRVISNIQFIARETGLSKEDIILAKIIGLVHDIGRHEQFMTYRTFDDSVSVNHAGLGIDILKKLQFFNGILDDDHVALVLDAVRNHNIHKLGKNLNGRLLLFSKLIRDADKVDIWKTLSMMNIVFKILDNDHPGTAYNVPRDFHECFRAGTTIGSGAVSMNDYRLLRLSWIYDMNFPATFRLILKHNYAQKILDKIPPSGPKDEIAGIIRQYILQKADGIR